ncbi:hypothetical protein [Streptosporangium sp. NBC_01756]|nr:hypothetical protein [Streptosporangium sp. NBC_01756]WSC89461.1 hypothetical protein OIE48_15140 [Streptosporangium sp. NBC_01756]
MNDRKRRLLVDTPGIVCKVYVNAANVGGRDGAAALLTGPDGSFSLLAYG